MHIYDTDGERIAQITMLYISILKLGDHVVSVDLCNDGETYKVVLAYPIISGHGELDLLEDVYYLQPEIKE